MAAYPTPTTGSPSSVSPRKAGDRNGRLFPPPQRKKRAQPNYANDMAFRGAWPEPVNQTETALRSGGDFAMMGYFAPQQAFRYATADPAPIPLLDRFRDNLREEYHRQAYDDRHRRFAEAVGVGGALALGGGLGAARGVPIVRGMSNTAKGNLGESLSVAKTLLRADIPVRVQTRRQLSKGYTVTDQETLRGQTVESKMAERLRLSRAQRLAQQELLPYRVDWWKPGQVGLAGGAAMALLPLTIANTINQAPADLLHYWVDQTGDDKN